MISEAALEVLAGYVPADNIYLREPMADRVTFRVGGEADCLIELENQEQLRKIQHYLKLIEEPFFILGNGSNLLVSDDGYHGVILQIGPKMSSIRVEGTKVIAQAGCSLAGAARAAMEHGLTGLEFASGIPGTVGGGVVMNAGAYGGELCQVVSLVTVINRDGEILELDNASMEFGYRTSAVRRYALTVTEVIFDLAEGNKEEIQAKMKELGEKRREKQPLEYPSAGSTFKRPEGHYAGELIMKAGMRGFQIGGARVSDKHCGFIINVNHATAADVYDLICEVRQRVEERFHVELEPEVMLLGRF